MGVPRLGSTNGTQNGHKPPPKRRTFNVVVKTIRAKGEPEGYRQLRDILFARYDHFARQGESLGTVIKLAIEASKHALMVEVHANKQQGGDAAKYDEFQAYLRGDTQMPPSPVGRAGMVKERPAATGSDEGGGSDAEGEED